MAGDGGRRAGLHRLRRGPHDLLGPAGRLAGESITREAAVTEIARRYREWVDLFRKPAGS